MRLGDRLIVKHTASGLEVAWATLQGLRQPSLLAERDNVQARERERTPDLLSYQRRRRKKRNPQLRPSENLPSVHETASLCPSSIAPGEDAQVVLRIND